MEKSRLPLGTIFGGQGREPATGLLGKVHPCAWLVSSGAWETGHSGGTIQEQEAKQGRAGDRDWWPDLLRVLCHLFIIGEAVTVRK